MSADTHNITIQTDTDQSEPTDRPNRPSAQDHSNCLHDKQLERPEHEWNPQRIRRADATMWWRVSKKSLARFTHELASLHDAGLPMLRSLRILADQHKPGRFRQIVEELGGDIRNGATLAEAMAEHPGVFDRVYLNMVAAGESSGQLSVILSRLQDFLERTVRIRRRIILAMLYPSLLVVFALLVVAFVQYMSPVSVGFNLFGPLLLLVLLLGGVCGAVKLIGRLSAGRHALDVIKLNVPVIGKIAQQTAVARAMRTLGMLLGAGVPMLEAAETARQTAGNEVLSRAMLDVRDSIRAGHGMLEPLRRSRAMGPVVLDMIRVGEETGDLDRLLLKVAQTEEDEATMRIDVLISLLRPVAMIAAALFVGSLVVMMFMQAHSAVGVR